MRHSKTHHLECYFLLHGTIRGVKSRIQCFDFLKIVLQWSWNNVFRKISFMDKLMFVFILIQKRKIQCWHFIENRHAKFQPAVILSVSNCENRFQRFIIRLELLLKMTPTPQKKPHSQNGKEIYNLREISKNTSVREQLCSSFSAPFLWESNTGKTTHFS